MRPLLYLVVLSLFLSVNANKVTQVFADFASAFGDFMHEVDVVGNEGTPERKATWDSLQQRITDFEERVRDDYNDFTKTMIRQLAATTRRTAKKSGQNVWQTLGEKASVAITKTKGKLQDLVKKFIETIHGKISSQKVDEKYNTAAEKLLDKWTLTRTVFGESCDNFGTNFQKLLTKLHHHSQNEQIGNEPILMCAGKQYTLVSFLTRIEGSRVHEVTVDLDTVEGMLNL